MGTIRKWKKIDPKIFHHKGKFGYAQWVEVLCICSLNGVTSTKLMSSSMINNEWRYHISETRVKIQTVSAICGSIMGGDHILWTHDVIQSNIFLVFPQLCIFISLMRIEFVPCLMERGCWNSISCRSAYPPSYQRNAEPNYPNLPTLLSPTSLIKCHQGPLGTMLTSSWASNI